MPFCVYILASQSRNLYVGMTNNIVRRLGEHGDGLVPFTSRYRIGRLVHLEESALALDAVAREKQIRRGRERRG